MPRVTDLGITIGLLPSGPTGSVLDVPGAGLGHATVWRDEPPPPAGRGIARTGVTVLDPGGDLFTAPVPAGAAVLNGAGECTGMLAIREWGLAETPVFLTSTMQVGRVYDAACELLIEEQPAIGVEDVIIPVVAECDDSFLSEPRRMQVSRDDVRAALGAARASAGGAARAFVDGAEGAVGAGTGMTCLGYKGGIGTASRVLPDGHTVAVVTLTNFGDRERLTVAGRPPASCCPPRRRAPAGRNPPARASSSRSPTGRSTRPGAAGWPAGPGSAWPGPGARLTTPAARSSWRWPPGCAPRAAARWERRSPAARSTVTSPPWWRRRRRPCSTACCRRRRSAAGTATPPSGCPPTSSAGS